jgi:phosphopantothenoylcysteine decarboxylase / phosphopantothenate---cysteine ligase
MARILLGVTGGVAAFKALELVRLATGAGHAVRVVQTPASQAFVGAASFAAITGAPVLTDEFERDPARGVFPDQPAPDHDPLSHLELVANADVLVIAPASANTIAKLTAGLADNLLCTAALAADCPVLVAPAMNDRMWAHAATRANVATLRERGVTVLEPGVGRLGSLGEWGAGRLPEPPEILAAAEGLLTTGFDIPPATPATPLDGLRVLVTAGGTREPIDAVRYIGNRSSGRMGFAVADEAAALGARVAVVAANVDLPRSPGVRYVDVGTAAELQAACEEEFGACDVLVMAAAVVDFRPSDVHPGKLKKTGDAQDLDVRLERTPDILAGLAARKRPGQTIVGFAAEHGEGALGYGREKLARKGLDAIVVNDVGQVGIGFDALDNEVTIITSEGEVHVPRAAKSAVARTLLGEVRRLRAAGTPAPAGVDQ